MLGIRKKDETDFLNLLIHAAENTLKAAHMFRNALMSGQPPARWMNEVKQLEEVGDDITHKIYKGLTLKHPCPIEYDILIQLAARLDDVLDGIEATTARFDYLNITASDECMIQFSEILVVSCDHLIAAFTLLSRKKFMQIREHIVAINELENQADRVMREGIRNIFQNQKDPYHDFKLKEVDERLEETTDRCEGAANLFESIILKHA